MSAPTEDLPTLVAERIVDASVAVADRKVDDRLGDVIRPSRAAARRLRRDRRPAAVDIERDVVRQRLLEDDSSVERRTADDAQLRRSAVVGI